MTVEHSFRQFSILRDDGTSGVCIVQNIARSDEFRVMAGGEEFKLTVFELEQLGQWALTAAEARKPTRLRMTEEKKADVAEYRKEIEGAIKWARGHQRNEHRVTGNGEGTPYGILADAAEKYLATLPKPMWTVRAWKFKDGPFENNSWPTWTEAMRDANGFLSRGYNKVEIEAP